GDGSHVFVVEYVAEVFFHLRRPFLFLVQFLEGGFDHVLVGVADVGDLNTVETGEALDQFLAAPAHTDDGENDLVAWPIGGAGRCQRGERGSRGGGGFQEVAAGEGGHKESPHQEGQTLADRSSICETTRQSAKKKGH